MKIGQIFKLIITILTAVGDMLEDNQKEKEAEKEQRS